MSQASLKSGIRLDRRFFIGGSDARVIMGTDEAALVRLWRRNGGGGAGGPLHQPHRPTRPRDRGSVTPAM